MSNKSHVDLDLGANNLTTTGLGTLGSLEVSGDIHLTTDGDQLLLGTANDYSIEFDGDDALHTVSGVAKFSFKNTSGALIEMTNDQSSATVFEYKAGQSANFSMIPSAKRDLWMFEDSANGDIADLRIFGYPTGLSLKFGNIKIADLNGSPAFKITTNTGEIDFNDENLHTEGHIYQTLDNAKHYWGTGNDVSTYFDGSDLIINSENITLNDEVHFTNFDKYTFDNDVEVSGAKVISEYMVPIWAEENSTLASTTYEWAFGNGANAALDDGVTIYVPAGYTCTIVAMSLRLGATPTAITVELGLNGVLQGANCDVTCTAVRSATNDSFTPISVSDGDYITFRTTSVSGTTAAPNVVTAWLKYTKT